MKLRKFMRQLGLLLAVVLGVGLIGEKSVEAASLPAGVGPLSTQSAYYEARTDNAPMYIGQTSIGSTTGQTSPAWTISTRPKLQAPIAANGRSSNGRITDKTTKIYILLSGSFGVPSYGSTKITSIKPVVMASNVNPARKVAEGTNLLGSTTSTSSLTVSSNYYEMDVDLSDLRNSLPLNFGFAVTYSNTSTTDYLIYARVDVDSALEAAWGGTTFDPVFYLNGTYKATQGGNVKQLRGSDKTITGGAGQPGLKTELSLSKDGNDNTYYGVIDPDGTFTFNLSDYLANMADASTGRTAAMVTEYDDMGDKVSVSANYVKTLDISPDEANLDIDPNTSEDLKGESDSEILSWIAKQAGVSVSYLDTHYNLSDVTLKSDQTGLGAKIAALANGDSLIVKMGATNSDGVTTDGTSNITLTRTTGELRFSSISSLMDFGSVAVPSKETLFAPTTTPDVSITDTQASGTPWYVTAQASELTSNDGRTLNGHMVYVDSDGNKQSMSSAVLVAAGQRDRSITYPLNTAKGWSTTNQSLTSPANGMYLDALPSIYSGSTSTQYTGTITWLLENTPDAIGTDNSGPDTSDSSSSSNSGSSSDESSNESGNESGGETGSLGGGDSTQTSSTSSSVYNAFG
ncbi:WxL domain-containing protein [Levilactobacillus fujinensis]|uniref:WxL domain-containing protein n=1 Tax=Levilactobacillus fujinensis TaxID=2486024 RepID=A0ABW1TFQ5_9LACO|nr:WxL domain-containing protein [Levilactobacillus fujinensis]